jgi:hypothetical protein
MREGVSDGVASMTTDELSDRRFALAFDARHDADARAELRAVEVELAKRARAREERRRLGASTERGTA